MNPTSLRESLSLIEVTPTLFVSITKLREFLPDINTLLFFGKVYSLDYRKVSELLRLLFNVELVQVITDGGHSTELQDYLVDIVPSGAWPVGAGEPDPGAPVPDSVLLTELFESANVKVAASIKEVAEKLGSVLHLLPSKEGSMVFKSMAKLNRNRPTIGTWSAAIQHQRVPDVAVVLDVSGSMTEETVRTIVSDVVALAYNTNAHLIIVSNSAKHWTPGTASVDKVLDQAEYGGTHYEQLLPFFEKDWGTVVCIADYDSSRSAQSVLAKCKGRIGVLLDISLVGRPTFLGECLGQLADQVEPLLVGRNLISW